MGGQNAVAFAIRYPERVKGIVMMGGPTLSGEDLLNKGGHDEIFSAHQQRPSACMTFYRNLGLQQDIAIEAAKWPAHVFVNQTAALLKYLRGTACQASRHRPWCCTDPRMW